VTILTKRNFSIACTTISTRSNMKRLHIVIHSADYSKLTTAQGWYCSSYYIFLLVWGYIQSPCFKGVECSGNRSSIIPRLLVTILLLYFTPLTQDYNRNHIYQNPTGLQNNIHIKAWRADHNNEILEYLIKSAEIHTSRLLHFEPGHFMESTSLMPTTTPDRLKI
jgi:hypothetical protein